MDKKLVNGEMKDWEFILKWPIRILANGRLRLRHQAKKREAYIRYQE